MNANTLPQKKGLREYPPFVPASCVENHSMHPCYVIFSNGSKHIQQQCSICGFVEVNYLKKSLFTDDQLLQIPPINTALRDYFDFHRGEFRRQIREHWKIVDNDEWWERYNLHLSSEKWASIRRSVFARAEGICEVCGLSKAQHVHHRKYDNLGDEPLTDLMAVCIPCHEFIHKKKIG